MSKAPTHRNDAVDLLDADHIRVKKMFDEYKRLAKDKAPGTDRQRLAETICMELTVHTQLEEEIFYPAIKGRIKDESLLPEAQVEHDGAKALISHINAGSPDEEEYDAKVTVLGEYIDHHVKEEREQLFPQARDSGVDLKALCPQLVARKEELTAKVEAAFA